MHYRREVIAAGVWFAVCAYVFMVMSNVTLRMQAHFLAQPDADWRTVRIEPLVDPLQRLLYDSAVPSKVLQNDFVCTSVSSGLTFAIVAALAAHGWRAYRSPQTLCRPFCSLVMWLGVLYALKGLFQLATLLPDANPTCLQRYPVAMMSESSAWIWTATYGFHGCGDMMFSGHTSCSLSIVLYTMATTRARLPWTSIASVVVGSIALALVRCRFHYTIDVLVGAALVGCAFAARLRRAWTPEDKRCILCNEA
jgi:hypothetical protein